MKAIRSHGLDGRKSLINTMRMKSNKFEYATHFTNIIFTSDWVDGTIKVPGNTSAVAIQSHLLF